MAAAASNEVLVFLTKHGKKSLLVFTYEDFNVMLSFKIKSEENTPNIYWLKNVYRRGSMLFIRGSYHCGKVA